MDPLPLPSFYRPDAAALAAAAADWRKQHALKPAAADERRVHLLLIDVQKDFCFPEGSLYVGGRTGRGAIEDSQRIAQFLYANLDRPGPGNKDDTSFLIPLGVGVEYRLNPRLSLDTTAFFNFTDINVRDKDRNFFFTWLLGVKVPF